MKTTDKFNLTSLLRRLLVHQYRYNKLLFRRIVCSATLHGAPDHLLTTWLMACTVYHPGSGIDTK